MSIIDLIDEALVNNDTEELERLLVCWDTCDFDI